MLDFIKKFFDSNEKQLSAGREIVGEVNGLEKKVSKMSFEEIRGRMDEIRDDLKPLVSKVPQSAKSSLKSRDITEPLPDFEQNIIDKLQTIVPEVFAMVREITKRKFNRRHYDVQILAGIILAQGNKLTEVKTGEGKTQIFHLPTALYALTGRGAHVVSVNDYLTRRDGEYAGHILSELGLSVGVVAPGKAYKFVSDSDLKKIRGEEVYEERMEVDIKNPGDVRGWNLVECSKKDAYKCDVVYGTNNEFGFDYLRDNMATEKDRIVQGELYYCIVDEVDSILIDEARTPLIISAPAEKSNELYMKFARVVPNLKKDTHYTVDEKSNSVLLTDNGIEKMEELLGVKNIWEDASLAHHLENALKAYELYQKDDEYIIKDGKVMIVDQFTGRVLPGRRYSEGLHQAIEAKEGVEIKQESKTLATITFQNFFRLYKVLAGGSGTVMTEAEEFFKIYNADSVAIPTNVPVIRKDLTDRVYKNQEAKFNAIVEEVVERNEKKQPILVGTTSVEKSEYLSRVLDKRGVDHEVLNAKHHEREAHIVAKAGQKSAVTIATNMAGRGTDIKLEDGVTDVGGLAVIGSERHEARRIDNQLRGRSGRQGDPGVSRFYVALDDEIMRMQGGDFIQGLMNRTNVPDDMPIESKLVSGAIERAQKRMEGHHFDIRNNVVKYDDVMNQQREIFYVRRRRILENAEKARLRIDKDTSDKDKKSIDEAREALDKEFKEQILGEIVGIVSIHIDEKGKIEYEKVIDEFLDFGDDETILASFVNLSKDNPNFEIKIDADKGFSPKEQLMKVLKGKSREKIEDLLKKVGEKMIESKKNQLGEVEFYHIGALVMLQAMDQLWTDHLDAMQDLREGIGLRGVAQRDPLVEYKNEAFDYFESLIQSIESRFARRIFKVRRASDQGVSIQANTNVDEIEDMLTGSREMMDAVRDVIANKGKIASPKKTKKKKKPKTVVNTQQDVGRNDPCPCGSGKKYKKCCGKL